MKKVNFRNAIMALVVTLSFVVFGDSQLNAQTLTGSADSPYSVPVGDFASPTDAQDILAALMLDLKGLMDNQSGPVLAVNERIYYYYYGIHTSLESGQTTPKAIIDGFRNLNDTNGNGELTSAELTSLKQLAVTALEQ